MIFDPKDEREDLLLAALLGDAEERRRARARLEREPGGAAELQELAQGLAQAAGDLRRGSRAGADACVARVLAHTTRRAAAAPRGGRRRAPVLARAVAAAALALLAAGTLLAAWRLQRAPAPRLALRAEPAAAPAPASGANDALALDVARLRDAARQSALARERALLEQRAAHAPVVELGPNASPEARLLAARAQTLRAGLVGAGREEPLPPPPEALGLALWTELELDRLVLTGAPSDALPTACLRLQDLARDAALAARSPGTAALVRSAERRALGLGLLEGQPPESSPELLSRAWFVALDEAGRESGLEDAPWKGWLARGPE